MSNDKDFLEGDFSLDDILDEFRNPELDGDSEVFEPANLPKEPKQDYPDEEIEIDDISGLEPPEFRQEPTVVAPKPQEIAVPEPVEFEPEEELDFTDIETRREQFFAPYDEEEEQEETEFEPEKQKKAPRVKKEKPPKQPKIYEPAVFESPLYKKTMTVRLIILFFFGLGAGYITLAPVYTLPIFDFILYTQSPFYTMFALCALHCVSIILALDVAVPGLLVLHRMRPNALTLVTVANMASLLYTLSVIIFPKWGGLLPYTSVSILSLFFALAGVNSEQKAEARVKKVCKAEYSQSNLYFDSNLNIIRKKKPEIGVIPRVNIGFKSKYGHIYATVVLALSLGLAVAACVLKSSATSFLWTFSAITTVSASFSSVCFYVLPMSFVAKRLASMGAALTERGDQGLIDARYAAVSDYDLFPVKSISLKGLKLYGDFSLDKVLAYTTSAINQNQSSIGAVFMDMLKSQFGSTVGVDDLSYHESGGISCVIGGDQVLIGTCGFMLMRGVDVHHGKNLKNGVFVAINSKLAGIFAFIYQPQPDVRRALSKLIKIGVTPVITSLDFNINQAVIELRFKLKPDTTDYPDLDARMDILDGNCDHLVPAGIMSIDDLSVYASLVLGAKKVKKATRINNLLSGFSTLAGMGVVFALVYANAFKSALPGNMLLYMFLWFVPVYFISKRSANI